MAHFSVSPFYRGTEHSQSFDQGKSWNLPSLPTSLCSHFPLMNLPYQFMNFYRLHLIIPFFFFFLQRICNRHQKMHAFIIVWKPDLISELMS